jgi:hypothetical protein
MQFAGVEGDVLLAGGFLLVADLAVPMGKGSLTKFI